MIFLKKIWKKVTLYIANYTFMQGLTHMVWLYTFFILTIEAKVVVGGDKTRLYFWCTLFSFNLTQWLLVLLWIPFLYLGLLALGLLAQLVPWLRVTGSGFKKVFKAYFFNIQLCLIGVFLIICYQYFGALSKILPHSYRWWTPFISTKVSCSSLTGNSNLFSFVIGFDGVSLLMIGLTVLIMFIVNIYFLGVESKKLNGTGFVLYSFALNLVQILLLWSFVTLDFFWFYIFFEMILFPMFIIIGFSKTIRKNRASFLFLVYTVFGSIFLLLGLLLLKSYLGSTSFFHCLAQGSTLNSFQKNNLICLFFLGFGVKVPLVPFHLWLIEAHVESPTTGSMVLAALLLKLGVYGLVRFMFEPFPEECCLLKPLLLPVCVIGALHASLLVFRQHDLKRFVAYTSIAHMNLSICGLFFNNGEGYAGCLFSSVAHGFSSAGLFCLIGILYDRYGNRNLNYFSGLDSVAPALSLCFLFFSFLNFGFPGSGNFIGELFLVIGACQRSLWIVFFLLLCGFLSVGYSLFLYSKVFGGTTKITHLINFNDLVWGEKFAIYFLLFASLTCGLYPDILWPFIYTKLKALF